MDSKKTDLGGKKQQLNMGALLETGSLHFKLCDQQVINVYEFDPLTIILCMCLAKLATSLSSSI